MNTYPPRDYWPTIDWKEAASQDMGMDPAVLAEMHSYASEHIPQLHALLIVRHGYLVFEEYYQGFHQDSYHSISSATKSIVSALVGIALREGFIKSLDQRVLDFFPEFAASADIDARKRALTLRHLLNLTGGFSREFPHEYWLNPVQLALERPMLHWPGEQFFYDSQGVDLVAGILTRVTGKSAAAFAHETLFTSLGIWQEETARFVWKADPQGKHTWHGDALWDEQNGYPWKVDPQGYSTGAFGAHLRAREMAKFGYLYLNEGLWDVVQVVPANYVAASTSKQSEGGPPVGVPYGYLWWVTQLEHYAAFFASGFGGKYIYVVPDLDLVFVTATTSDRSKPGEDPQELITRFVIPAITTDKR